MSRNQKIFYKAIEAGCKTAQDLALYIKNQANEKSIKFLESSENKTIKRYFKDQNIYIAR